VGINTPRGLNKREEARGKKPQTPVQKQVAETKQKAHESLYGKKS